MSEFVRYMEDAQNQVNQWANRKGWNAREIPVPEMIALLHSEISEALEAYRKNEPLSWIDDEGKPQGIGSEFADTLVRLFHYSAQLGINLGEEFECKMKYNETRPYRHGGKLA